MAEKQNNPGPHPGFAAEFTQCWQQLPNKAFFFALLAAWFLLFQCLGNATFGYIDTTSLFRWMFNSYWNPSSTTALSHGEAAPAHGLGYISSGFTDDGHGLLIPLIVLGLFWWKREKLLALPSRVWWPALLLLGASLALHVVGYLIQQPRLSIVALLGGVYALIGLAWGPTWLKASFFPFFLLVFCIPMASLGGPVTAVTFYLRLYVAKIVATISGAVLGMDVIREGTNLYNSSHTYSYEVAAACSGLRSLLAIFALSTIYSFMTFEKSWKRLLMMAAAVPLAMLGNVARMLLIIITAGVSGQSAGNFVHENWFFSLVPYVPPILGVMLLGHWLRERPQPVPAALTPKPV